MLPSHEIKRQILAQSDVTHIKSELLKLPPGGPTEGEIIQMGNDIEKTIKTPGWTYIESWVLRHIDIVGAFSEGEFGEQKRGHGQAMMMLLQYVDQIIKARNALIEKESRKGKENGNK